MLRKIETTDNKISIFALKLIILLAGILFIWFIVQGPIGISIHESGHYLAGKLLGCDNLTINIAKFSFDNSISSVSGWEFCNKDLVVNPDGSRICNLKTIIVNLSGIVLVLLVLIPILFSLRVLRNKTKSKIFSNEIFYLFLTSLVIFALQSAGNDLFKVAECLFGTQVGEIIFSITYSYLQLIIPLWFLSILIKEFYYLNLHKLILSNIKR